MNTPETLKYSKSHEWVKDLGDGTFEIGLTDFAQDALGDLVFINLPEVDDEATAGETVCDVESVKAVSDVYSPVTGTITEVNETLQDEPQLINEDPYGAWLFRVTNVTGTVDLLDAAAYEKVCEEEA
ncbi:MAG: glycine cleavage system protein GcvH [Erysipelotrichaceae bacterium]|nr:glycine cleavage system protein GcvH [Erysipelotrichaceae bacterium]